MTGDELARERELLEVLAGGHRAMTFDEWQASYDARVAGGRCVEGCGRMPPPGRERCEVCDVCIGLESIERKARHESPLPPA